MLRSLAIALGVYVIVAVSALAAVGPAVLARSAAPLATAVRAGDLDGLVPAVRIGGTVAALGVLLSLIAGVSRTAFAMADDGHLPRWFAAVHPTRQVPHRTELAAGQRRVLNGRQEAVAASTHRQHGRREPVRAPREQLRGPIRHWNGR